MQVQYEQDGKQNISLVTTRKSGKDFLGGRKTLRSVNKYWTVPSKIGMFGNTEAQSRIIQTCLS